jgi:hypothetical protein
MPTKAFSDVNGLDVRTVKQCPPFVDAMSYGFIIPLPCDVQVGDHPAQYNMREKYAKLQSGGPNPFIDRANCNVEADIQEAMFKAVLAEQSPAAR